MGVNWVFETVAQVELLFMVPVEAEIPVYPKIKAPLDLLLKNYWSRQQKFNTL